jgi:hypothetical protein
LPFFYKVLVVKGRNTLFLHVIISCPTLIIFKGLVIDLQNAKFGCPIFTRVPVMASADAFIEVKNALTVRYIISLQLRYRYTKNFINIALPCYNAVLSFNKQFFTSFTMHIIVLLGLYFVSTGYAVTFNVGDSDPVLLISS